MSSALAVDPTSQEYERAVARRWGAADRTVRSFWQSPVVMAEINRRITGDPQCKPHEYFVRRYCPRPRPRGLSLGCGDGWFERELLRLSACERLVAVDLSPERLERARANTPTELAGRIEYVCANLETWEPAEKFDLVFAKGVLHHVDGLERLLSIVADTLLEDGLLYVDEFVGPSRFQWSDSQLAIVNRLLARLSEDLRADLVDPARGPKAPASRPPVAAMIEADPSEAARSAELRELLRSHLQPLEEREWGGAVFHLLFSRIMGNFAGNDDLVRVIMEIDAILTEAKVVSNDCLFGVYGRPALDTRGASGRAKKNAAESRVTVAKRASPGSARGGRSTASRRLGRKGNGRSTNGRPSPDTIDLLATADDHRAVPAHRPNGRIEAVSDGRLIGWAADLAEPDRRLSLDVFIDNKLVRKVLADQPRADLLARGIGDGAHGFRVELPRHVLDGRRHYVGVAARGIGFGLPAAGGFGERCVSAPEGSRFEMMRLDPLPPDLPTPRVLDGEDGWAFLCDDANGNLDQLLGDLRFSDSDLRDYREILERNHHRLERLGIPYFFAIAPAKEAIYPERLPTTTPSVRAPRTARQLLDALGGSQVRTVDLHAPLRRAALAGQILYYRRDAHWTYEGALLATQALLADIRDAGVEVRALAAENLTWLDERFVGDLAEKPTVALVDGRLEPISPRVPAAGEEADRRPALDSLGLRKLDVLPHLAVSETRESVVLENHREPRAPRAIVYRDSSARWMLPFLAAGCSWSAWLWKTTLDFELIERERPDFVVQVVTERFLPRVPY